MSGESTSRVAIITGAGSGIGRATALRLAGEAASGGDGWTLVLTGRTESTLDATATMLGDAAYIVHPADVSDPRACEQLIEAANLRFGRIDLLANIAGYATQASIPDTDDELWRKTFDVNASSVMYLTRAAWPIFAAQSSGVIVNLSSMASIDPFPGFAAYAAAKAAVNLYTLMTAREGEAIGVKAVAIAPGAVETPLLRSMFDEQVLPADQTLDPAVIADLIADCATGRRVFAPGEVIPITPDTPAARREP